MSLAAHVVTAMKVRNISLIVPTISPTAPAVTEMAPQIQKEFQNVIIDDVPKKKRKRREKNGEAGETGADGSPKEQGAGGPSPHKKWRRLRL